MDVVGLIIVQHRNLQVRWADSDKKGQNNKKMVLAIYGVTVHMRA